MDRRDPVEVRTARDRDLYDIATWEPRTALDRFALRVYNGGITFGRTLVFLVGLLLTLLIAGQAVTEPTIGVLTILSAIPALALAGYVYYTDITENEPLALLAATFLLSIVFASFAAIINSVFGFVQTFGLIGATVFFYLVVGPVEETVKLLAVRFYAFRKPSFDAVIDGAVYGAVAGLGFATIENAIYIFQGIRPTGGAIAPLGLNALLSGSDITITRALAGPGHVVYSAFAGYYLGLAKFNPDNAGPIIVKGILIAAFIHATYNTFAGIIVAVVATVTDAPVLIVFFGFVLLYQGFFGAILLRKLNRYRRAYRDAHGGESQAAERVEFDT